MIVPSRSRKTAGRVSSDETVILKAGDQFLVRDGGRSEFADDNGAAVVRDLSRFARRRFATKGERKQRNGGVARARDIENLSRLRGNVMRPIPFLKKHHTLFAQSDEQELGVPLLQQGFAGFQKRLVLVSGINRV